MKGACLMCVCKSRIRKYSWWFWTTIIWSWRAKYWL